MTVNYNLCVSTSSPLSLFKLLLRWKGSVWKAIYMELAIWLLLYACIACIYRHALNEAAQEHFTAATQWINSSLKYVPMDFMLGFFVSVVVNRWGVLFSNIGLIDTLALTIAGYVKGKTEQERLWRRNVIRYCVLSQVLVFRDISMQVRNRFPTLDTVVAAGIMMPHEREKFEELQYGYGKPWMPFQWAICQLRKAREHGSISSDYLFEKCVEQVRIFRINMATLTNYDWVPIPIMYPQIVFLAVYTFFAFALIGRQVPTNSDEKMPWFGRYLPIMTALQFLFYMGWLKVAEALLNPLGEDDDDFETNFLIDRNLTYLYPSLFSIGLTIVDHCFDDPPEEKKDRFWSEPVLPLYSEQSANRMVNPLEGSAAAVELPSDVQTVTMIGRSNEGGFQRRQSTRVSVRRNSQGSSNAVDTPDIRRRKPRELTPSFVYEKEVIDEEEPQNELENGGKENYGRNSDTTVAFSNGTVTFTRQ